MSETDYPKLKNVTVLDEYRLLIEFSNGEKKIYDFSHNLGHPYYKELKDRNKFKNVKINEGEIEWVTGQDFCPNTLYEDSVDYTATNAKGDV